MEELIGGSLSRVSPPSSFLASGRFYFVFFYYLHFIVLIGFEGTPNGSVMTVSFLEL